MSISAYTFTGNSTVSNTTLIRSGAKLKVAKGERYRFVDANGNPPTGLQITQVGQDAKVEWLDEDSPRGGKSFLTLENFNATPDVAISAPSITPAQVQGLNLASDTSLITSTNAFPAELVSNYAEPTLTGAAALGAGWWMGLSGVAVAAGASGGGGGGSAPAPVLDTTAPTITIATIVSAPTDHNYAVGSDPLVQVRVVFSEAVVITGAPTINLNIGGTVVQATYNALTGYFEYTVTNGTPFDANGLAVVANSLALNGGSIVDAAGNAAVITHAGIADSLNHTVGTEVHTIVGTASDENIFTNYLGYSGGNSNPAIGTGSMALLSGGNRLWSGDDSVSAGDGNDIVFVYGADVGGNDTIDGGNGTDDAIVYSDLHTSITVDLSGATQTVNLGAAGNETISGFEAYILGQGNDVFIGGSDAVTIVDHSGNDTITGSSANDFIMDTDSAADVIDGGAGIDTLSYRWDLDERSSSITVDLSTGTDSDGNVLTSIENLELSHFADSAIGSSAANYISSLSGNDTLDGGAGQDTIDGGDGDDYVLDSDIASADDLAGGNGSDTIDFSATDTTHSALGGLGLVIDLAHGLTAYAATPGVQFDTLSGFEYVIGTTASDSITGSSLSDTLDGSLGADYIDGYLGNDVLLGDDGTSDTLHGGLGADSIVGDALDYASYEGAATAISVNLHNSGLGYGISSEGDILVGIQNLIGSDYGDTLMGNANNNIIHGGNGDNYIDAGNGDDTVAVGSGANTVYGGLGADNITGGNDSDLLYGGDDDDIIDAGEGSNTVYGDAGNDQITLGSGDDTVYDGKGVDALVGGDGANTYFMAEDQSHDQVIGGRHTDTMDYSLNTALGISADLGGGGNGSAKIFLYDSASGNTLGNADGGSEIETIVGTHFADVFNISGSAGSAGVGGNLGWVVHAGAGNDTVNVIVQTANHEIYGGDGNDRLTINSGKDIQLYGDDGDDVLEIIAGYNNTLVGGLGNDTVILHITTEDDNDLSGGDDTDTLDLSDAGSVAVENGALVKLDRAGAGHVSRIDDTFEVFIFGASNDEFDGRNVATGVTVYSGGGKDIMRMGVGDDTVVWQDTVAAGGGTFSELDGGTGYDVLDLSQLLPAGNFSWRVDAQNGPGTNVATATDALPSGASSSSDIAYSNFEHFTTGNGSDELNLTNGMSATTNDGSDTIRLHDDGSQSGFTSMSTFNGGVGTDLFIIRDGSGGTTYDASAANTTLSHIEHIELQGGGHTLVIDAAELLAMSDSNILELTTDGSTATVQITDITAPISLWMNQSVTDLTGQTATTNGAGGVSFNGVDYIVYQSGSDYLLVQNTINVVM